MKSLVGLSIIKTETVNCIDIWKLQTNKNHFQHVPNFSRHFVYFTDQTKMS